MNPRGVRNAGRPERIREEATRASIQETDLPTEIPEAVDGRINNYTYESDIKRAERLLFFYILDIYQAF